MRKLPKRPKNIHPLSGWEWAMIVVLTLITMIIFNSLTK